MYRMKRIVATVLLLLVMGLGTPQVFADGAGATSVVKPTEMPGVATPVDPLGMIDQIVIYIVSDLIP
jgi:hypothetical protein